MAIVVLSGVRTPEARPTDLWNSIVGYQNANLAAALQFYNLANQATAPEDKAKLSQLANSLLINTYGVDSLGNINFGVEGQKDSATIKAAKELEKTKQELRRGALLEYKTDPNIRSIYNEAIQWTWGQPEAQKYLQLRTQQYKKEGRSDDEAQELANRDIYNLMLDHLSQTMRPSYESTIFPIITQPPPLGADALVNQGINAAIKWRGYAR